MQKVTTHIVDAMFLASSGCAWRPINIGVKRSESQLEDYPALGSCVGGFV